MTEPLDRRQTRRSDQRRLDLLTALDELLGRMASVKPVLEDAVDRDGELDRTAHGRKR